MGYSHYWRITRSLNDAEWAEVQQAVRKIIDFAAHNTTQPIKIRGPLGRSAPEFADHEILLNGCDERGEGYETFVLGRYATDFESCKTGHKPYDAVVVACLAYMTAKWGYVADSDGDVLDWDAGLTIVNAALGEHIPNPLIVAQLTA